MTDNNSEEGSPEKKIKMHNKNLENNYDEVNPTNLNGKTLKGKYQVEQRIGSGAFGAVYKAKYIETGELKAIKVLKRFEKMENEIAVLTRLKALSHTPCSLMMFDEYFTLNKTQIIVFPLMVCDLQQLIEQNDHRLMAAKTVEAIFKQVANGLSFLHSQKIHHRDIKTENILLTPASGPAVIEDEKLHIQEIHICVSDFGISVSETDAQKSIAGTKPFMSVEMILGSYRDHSCDIYSLACVGLHLLTGDLTFHSRSTLQQIKKIIDFRHRLEYALKVGFAEKGIDIGYWSKDIEKQTQPVHVCFEKLMSLIYRMTAFELGRRPTAKEIENIL